MDRQTEFTYFTYMWGLLRLASIMQLIVIYLSCGYTVCGRACVHNFSMINFSHIFLSCFLKNSTYYVTQILMMVNYNYTHNFWLFSI